MKELLEPHVIISLAVIVGSLSVVAIVLIIVLRDKISAVSLSRKGLQIQTNDVVTLVKSFRKADQIDISTRKSIRKATMGLMILDPEKYGMTAEVMLVNREANLSLIYSAYENHHTRELSSEGADVYIANKANDISETIRVLKKYFPKLTDEMAHNHACLWIKKILIPNVRKACYEKLEYYKAMCERDNVIKILKDELARCIRKNERYIAEIDELAARPDIKDRTSIVQPIQTRGEQ
jgi:hypothetical protein